MIARYAILDRYIRKHAKLLDVGAAHRFRRSVIQSVYDRGDARRFLDSLLSGGRAGTRRIDHCARFRLTTPTDSEPSPRARLDEGGPGQSTFGHLVKFRRAPTS